MDSEPDPALRAISQRLLDTTGAAYRNDDFATFAECFLLPLTVSTFEGDRRVTARTELREVFDNVRAYLASLGVTDLARRCVSVDRVSEDRIEATHISELRCGDQLLSHPYPGFSVLVRCADRIWRVADAQYALEHQDFAEAVMGHRNTGAGPAPCAAGPPHSPVEIYQAWIDDISQALWDRAFDRVGAAMIYPHTMRTRDAEVRFDSPRQMAEAAQEFRGFLSRHGAHAYHRICTGAEADAGGIRITGRHMTYILRSGVFVVPPFENRMTLVRDGSGWKGAGIWADIENSSVTILSPTQLAATSPQAQP